jgi:ribosomal protein S12 methylthiotransferase
MKGKTIEVLIERPAGRELEDGYVARSQSQAPDIDSVTFIKSPSKLHPGQLLDVKVTDYQAYDLVAELPVSKSRRLAVMK